MNSAARRRVVVVEDDDGMREAIESQLDAAGFSTTVYGSAEALLASDAVDDALCIVSDLMLPAMSGLELLSELRARGTCPPVILITAHDSPGVRGEAGRRGAAGYLSKPFPGSALLAAIENVAGSTSLK